MRTTTINRTNLTASAIGLGAMHLSIDGRPSRENAIAVVHRALDRGVTFIDTADAYCLDESDKHHNENLVFEALQQYDKSIEDVVVATKGGLMRPRGRWTRNGHPDHLRKTIRDSVEALGGGPITIWQHHAPDEKVSIEASLKSVKEAVAEGLIRFVGVSNYSVNQIERARDVLEIVSVQNQYSLWHRAPERNGVLEYCDREGLTFLPWGPLGGRSRARKIAEYPALGDLAEEKKASPHQIALAWLMSKSDRVLPIPGASRVESIEDSLRAADVKLSDAEIERIERSVED